MRPGRLRSQRRVMDYTLSCPSCGGKVRIPDSLIGKTVRCPRGQATYRAEAPAEAVEEVEGVDEPPRRRRPGPAPDDEYEDAPRRRAGRAADEDYEDDDRPRRRRRELSWLDKQFLNTSMVLLVLFPLCCGIVALVVGVIGMNTCEHPRAKRNA